jgi:hypothetical protein
MVTYELITEGFELKRDGVVVLRQVDEPEARPGTPLTRARAKKLGQAMVDYIVAAEEAPGN